MAMMLSKTYDAFIEVGVSAEQAKAAAEEVAQFELRLIRPEVLSAITLAGIGYIIVLLHSLK